MSSVAQGAWDKMLRFLGFGPDEEEYEECGTEEMGVGEPFPLGREAPRRGLRPLRNERTASPLPAGPANVVPLHSAGTPRQPFKVLLVEPRSFDDVQPIVDQLKARRPIILNLEGLDREVAHRILNFLHGAIYALGGETQKIASGIFFFAPPGVDLASFHRGLDAASGSAYDPTSLKSLLASATRLPLSGESGDRAGRWDLSSANRQGANSPGRSQEPGWAQPDWRR
ncbi:MAG: cell division protein SepF [Bacillota bacterium]